MDTLLVDTLITALPLVPVFMGIYIVFRVREDFDLTIDASFAFGAAIVAVLLIDGWGVVPAMVAATLAGGCLGLITTTMHLWLRIPVLLAGLVMSIGMFSINLHVLETPAVNLIGSTTLFSGLVDMSAGAADWATIGVMLAISAGALALLALFMRTEIGLALRATGVNARMARSQGVNDRAMLAISLFTANALAGLAGAIVTQYQGYADVNMGTGIFVAGVGAVLVGELLVRPAPSKVVRIVIAVFVGTIVYRLVLVGALRAGLPAEDLRLATALTLVIAFVAQRYLGPLLNVRRLRRPPGPHAPAPLPAHRPTS